MPFHIYRASAGAGKTFTLVKEYLRLALATDDAAAYAPIMAITFTNKAAGEMKERIFKTLELLSAGKLDSDMALALIKDLNTDGETLSKRADACLKHMLHNYGLIAISTIDKFTLRVLKGFTVELGLPSMFEVSLDQDELKVRVADDILAQVGENSGLTDSLVDFVEQRTDQEKTWTLDGELQKLAGTIFSEEGRLNMRNLEEVGWTQFKELRSRLQEFNSKFQVDMMAVGAQAIDLIELNGIDPSSLSYGNTGVFGYFNNLRIFRNDQNQIVPKTRVKGIIESEKWHSGKCPPDQELAIYSIKDSLIQLFQDAQRILDDRYSKFSIYKVVLSSLHGMSLLTEMKTCLDRIQEDEDIVSISEFNHLLNKEVMDQPAPFIYERLGHRYRHFLVDEFQDTSVLQWMNLLPLIDESLSGSGFSMVVGDGKQSIYRWRGGKVEQFTHLPDIYRDDLGDLSENESRLLDERQQNLTIQSEKFSLGKNYRSTPEVVDFNNGLFRSIAEKSSDEIKLVYEGLEQVPNRTDTGYVQAVWLEGEDKEEKQDAHCHQVVDWVQQCLDDDFRACEIAVLCRRNSEVRMIAATLMEAGFKVVSNDAMLVSGHAAVRLAIDLVRWNLDPQDKILCGSILRNMHTVLGLDETLSEFLKPLKENHELAVRQNLKAHLPELNLHELTTKPLYQLFGGLLGKLMNGDSDERIAAFMEFVATQSSKDGVDVQTFLEVWDQKSEKLTIAAQTDPDAVKILTVHSAKGLQFPVVIHPFIDYGSRPHESVIWAKTDRADLAPLKVVRTNATKALADTDMNPDLEKETDRSEMDVINTLYVALTRPENRLYMSLSQNGNSTKGAPLYIIDQLKELGHDLETDGIFTYGEERKYVRKDCGEPPKETISAPFNFLEESIAQVRKAAPSSAEDRGERLQSLEHGKMVHAILETVGTRYDLADLPNSELLKSVSDDEKESVIRSIRKVTEHEVIGKWFDQNLEVLNERDLMDTDGKVHRPDRMVRSAESTAILEYKTGNRAEVHEEQLGRYVNLLSQIDPKPCEAYLVYLPDVEVVKI